MRTIPSFSAEKRFLFVLAIGLLAGAHGWAQTAAKTNLFEQSFSRFAEEDRTNPPPAGAILLVGDSLFRKWQTVREDLPGYQLINRGFGGSMMSDLLVYMDKLVLPYRPRMIVVNEGGNDLQSGRTPEELLADVKTFVRRVREVMPDVPIVFDGLTPSPARWSSRDERLRVNVMLKSYLATGKNLIYLDLFDAFLGPDGKPDETLFLEDRLHNSAKGHAIRARLMRPLLGPSDFPAPQ